MTYFQALSCLLLALGAQAADFTVRCESWDNKPSNCAIPGLKSAKLTKQISTPSCTQGKSWGFDSSKLWVNQGCQGEFLVNAASTVPLVANANVKQRLPTSRPPDPRFFQTKQVSSTIKIDKPGLYDFNNVLHVWSGPGGCDQKEGQPPILLISSSNVVIKNFAYQNSPDGVHVFGKSKESPITNIVLENLVGWACEDAVTFRYVQGIKVMHSTFIENKNQQFRDKIAQMATGRDILVQNSRFIGEKTAIRLKSGSSLQLKWSAFYDNMWAFKMDSCEYNGYPKQAVKIRSEGNYFSNVKTVFHKKGDAEITIKGDELVQSGKQIEDEGPVTEKYCYDMTH